MEGPGRPKVSTATPVTEPTGGFSHVPFQQLTLVSCAHLGREHRSKGSPYLASGYQKRGALKAVRLDTGVSGHTDTQHFGATSSTFQQVVSGHPLTTKRLFIDTSWKVLV